MSEMPIHEADGHLVQVARQAASGEVVYLTEHGERLAALVPAHLVDELEQAHEQRVRQRLADAGLLAPAQRLDRKAPPVDAVEAASARASRGRPLSDYVSDGR